MPSSCPPHRAQQGPQGAREERLRTAAGTPDAPDAARLLRALLERALRSPILAFGIFFFLLNLTLEPLGAGWIQTTFFPVVERDDINVELEMVAGTREHIVNAELARIEDVMRRVNEELKASARTRWTWC